MWAANQALAGLLGVGVPQDWATHAIGRELTALYDPDASERIMTALFPQQHQLRDLDPPALRRVLSALNSGTA